MSTRIETDPCRDPSGPACQPECQCRLRTHSDSGRCRSRPFAEGAAARPAKRRASGLADCGTMPCAPLGRDFRDWHQDQSVVVDPTQRPGTAKTISAACGDGETADATRQGSLVTKLIADARFREAVIDQDSWPQDSEVPERYGQVQLLVAPALLASSWPHVCRFGSCARAAIRLPLLGSTASRLSAANGTLCRPGFGDLRSIRVGRAR